MYGIRYANFCFKVLPTHDYYNSTVSTHLTKLRLESLKNGRYVLDALADIVVMMDQEEIRLQKEKLEQVRKLPLEERLNMLRRSPQSNCHYGAGESITPSRSSEQKVADFLNEDASLVKFAGITPSSNTTNMEGKLACQTSPMPPLTSSQSSVGEYRYLFITIGFDEPTLKFYDNLRSLDDRYEFLTQTAQTLFRSLHSELDEQEEHILEDSDSHLSPNTQLFTDPTAPGYSKHPQIRTMKLMVQPSKQFPMNESCAPEDVNCGMNIDRLERIYTNIYQSWLSPLVPSKLNVADKLSSFEPQIVVEFLRTYQGRIDTSTNGCTVISPLCVIAHLHGIETLTNAQNVILSSNKHPKNIENPDIERIIDQFCVPVLSQIREKFGLCKYALIIPSDVHDFLLDERIQLLRQKDFVGVCGGNIFDAAHLGCFLKLICHGHENSSMSDTSVKSADRHELLPNDQKVGAALFYHEHVVSIVKCVHKPKSPVDDSTKILPRITFDLIDSSPRRINAKNDRNNVMAATRTRCMSINALEVLLRWYACSKLTEADRQYIDSNKWDDALCDFDPRVFQAFVWASRPFP